jgi:hypothetical protein
VRVTSRDGTVTNILMMMSVWVVTPSRVVPSVSNVASVSKILIMAETHSRVAASVSEIRLVHALT